MKEIVITINNKIATAGDNELIVNGNSDVKMRFVFDGEWNSAGIKTAVFVGSDGSAYYKVLQNNTCLAPVFYNTSYVKVGVISANVCTSTSARINCRFCVTDEASGNAPVNDDLYAKLCQMIEDKEASHFPVSINEEGNWCVGNTDTGVSAKGKAYVLTEDDKTEIAGKVPYVKIPTQPDFANGQAQMTNTDKAYVNTQTGTFWAYIKSKSVKTVTEEVVATADNPLTESARLSNGVPQVSGSYSAYFCTPFIDLSAYNTPFTLHLEGALFCPDAADSYTRWAVYDENKAFISEHRAALNNGINMAWDVPATAINVSEDNLTTTILFNKAPALANGTAFKYLKISAKGSPATARVYVSYEREVEETNWTDTGIPYAPALTEEDKQNLATEISALIDAEMLSLIGDEVTV